MKKCYDEDEKNKETRKMKGRETDRRRKDENGKEEK
jgi:hypothetical protein